MKCKRTYSIKTKTHAKHSNHYDKQIRPFHAVSKKYAESLTINNIKLN